MKQSYFILICSVLFYLPTNAQFWFYVNDTLEVPITKETKPEDVKVFLKEYKATDIEFNPNAESDFQFRLKNKKGNWMLFDAMNEAIFMEKQTKNFSFQFPSAYQEKMYFTWAKRKNKWYWVNTYKQEIEEKLAFDEVQKIPAQSQEHQDYSKVKIKVKNQNKWGLIEAYDEYYTFYVSRNFLYNTPEEVPKATGFEIYQLQMMEQIREDYKVDLLEALDNYGYYFKGRNKKSKLWGMFVGEGQVFGEIPMQFDDIVRHRNPETYEVWKNGKVGYYNSAFELLKEPIFDELQILQHNYEKACALKKDGIWQLFDPFDGSLVVEAKAKTIEELQALWSKP
ncbi:hypothetical protein [Psychroflexus planctonicus]|uniref:GLPGLI family protein n=1 Tax=Psychroflexus planctonicus TaxID=1526575 RepID=A0ABQ1SG21_9FLAO|nr:hypothetical protein [Psychroflexus planctonicus]GGE38250.1 hypothetical protein GCM10010832_18140 [Psychroflexus planctonicus]